jgi:hypothetical protein
MEKKTRVTWVKETMEMRKVMTEEQTIEIESKAIYLKHLISYYYNASLILIHFF